MFSTSPTISSADFLLIFAIVNGANFSKAGEIGSSRVLAGLGVLSCLFALGTLVWHTVKTSPAQIWVLFVMVSIACGVEFLYITVLRDEPRLEWVHIPEE